MTPDELDEWQGAVRQPFSDPHDCLSRELEAAAQEERWLDVVYLGGSAPGEKRRVKPLELFTVEGHAEAYLRAFCATRQEERTFRLDKIMLLSSRESERPDLPSVRHSERTKSAAEQISELLGSTPGLKAKQIAEKLGFKRAQVNSILHGKLKHQFDQDQSYRWWPKGRVPAIGGKGPHIAERPSTPLARLCRYYLDCLSQDRTYGVSVFASSRYDLDYAELDVLPLVAENPTSLFADESARGLLNRMRRDRSRLVMHLGYPVRLRYLRSQKGWEGFKVEPVFLFTLYQGPSGPYGEPRLGDDLPSLNFSVLRTFAQVGSGNLIDEAIQLSEELGLATADESLPEMDEVFPRLRSVRPDWDWLEEIDPYELSQGASLKDLTEQGIYNRAVLVTGERSPYTQGLETELSRLESVGQDSLTDTTLGQWLTGKAIDSPIVAGTPLLEVLPLNSEQREAVVRGLKNPLTVITGPPGTGKSQVVASLLINAAWQGKKVLFASKNNKAVDVVEDRVNSLGPRPVLLRLGRDEYQRRLSEYLTTLFASSSTHEDKENYDRHLSIQKDLEQRFLEFEEELISIITLRNETDNLEQLARDAEGEFGSDMYAKLRSADLEPCQQGLNELAVSLRRATRASQPLLVRLLWFLVKAKRIQHLVDTGVRLCKNMADLARQRGSQRAIIDELIVELLANAGLRASELTALNIEDLPVSHGKPAVWIRNGKGKVTRTVDIPETLVKRLERFVRLYRKDAKPKAPLLVSTKGGRMIYRSIYEKMKKLGKKSGIGKLHPHMLRHTYLSRLYNVEHDLRFVQDQAGHASPTTTAIYAKTNSKARRRQVEALDNG